MLEIFTTIKDKLNTLKPLEQVKLDLFDKHHPYGLLLMSAPFISAAAPAGSRIDAAGLSSSSLVIENSSDTRPGTSGKLLKDIASAGFLGFSFSGNSPGASLSSTGLALSAKVDNQGVGHVSNEAHLSIGALFSALGLSVGSDPNIANALQSSLAFDTNQVEAMVMPSLASADKEISSLSENRIEVSENKLRVGCVTANAFVYNGKKEFAIDSDSLDEPYLVRSKDIFLALHVNHDAKKYAQMKPLARIKEIKHDFQQLCELLDNPDKFKISKEQIKQIEKLKNAPIIGVSHLVRLIASRGLPTWGIDILPKVLQKFHTFDSQAVSNKFGGNRKVGLSDIRVMFIPPKMRNLVIS